MSSTTSRPMYPSSDDTPHDFCFFTLKGRDLDPAQVTETLGVSPDSAIRRGDANERLLERGGRPARCGCWLISTFKHVDSGEMREHLDWIMNRIDRARLPAVENVEQIDVSVFWHLNSPKEAIEFPLEFLQFLSAVNAKLYVDVTWCGEETQDS